MGPGHATSAFQINSNAYKNWKITPVYPCNTLDFFDLVQGIWQLARQGLCRAHEGNTDRPRVPLDAEYMLYPILDQTIMVKNKPFANFSDIIPYN